MAAKSEPPFAVGHGPPNNAVPPRRGKPLSKHFVGFANYIAEASGYPAVFAVVLLMVLTWLLSGPVFAFSDSWQLVMNTLTSVITFLMVFLIRTSQNRDSSALQAKIDELIRVSEARNLFVGIEHLLPTKSKI
jgi:low affinity Fe/Cu permease